MRIFAVIAIMLLAGCASSRTYMGHQVIDAPFVIAGGKTLMLPTTDAGPIPAENEKIKIEVAGFHVGPSKTNPKVSAITWTYGFTSKKSQEIESVMVEEVFPSDPAVLLLKDESPQLKLNSWSDSTASVEINPELVPWLYSPKPSIFVFKFSIKIKGEADQIYYQPTWFPAQAKAAMIVQ